MKKSLVCCILLLAVNLSVEGTTYEYHPSSTLHLGGGFNFLVPDKVFLPCIDFEEEHIEKDATTKTDFIMSVVHSRAELYQHLNIDAKLSASYLVASGSASMKFDDQYQFKSNDLVWILKASSDYGRYIMKNPKLNAEAKSLLTTDVHDAFANRCGTEYVAQERRIAQVAVVYSLHDLSESEKSELDAKLDASGYGLKAEASYKSLIQRANSVHQLTINIFGTGGKGVTLLSGIADTDDLDVVRNSMKAYLAAMGPAEAAPIEFTTGSWQSFGVDLTAEKMGRRSIVLPELYFAYVNCEPKYRKLGEILRHASDRTSALKANDVTSIQAEYATTADTLTAIAKKADDCLKTESSCVLSQPIMCKIATPEPVLTQTWIRTDAEGKEYKASFHFPSQDRHELPSVVKSGTFSLQYANTRIYKVVYISGGEDGCGHSYNPVPSEGYSASYKMTDDHSFTWQRKWEGRECTDGYDVYFEVKRTACVDFCDFN